LKNVSGATIGVQEAFADKVRSRFKSLPARQPDQRDKIRKSANPGHESPTSFNINWRKELYRDVQEVVESSSRELSSDLYAQAEGFVAECGRLLWGCAPVRSRILNDAERRQAEYQSAIAALFLRFARPAAESIVRHPVGSMERRNSAESNKGDLELIDGYHLDGSIDVALQRLKLYVDVGPALLVSGSLREAILGKEFATTLFDGFAVSGVSTKMIGDHPALAESDDQVIAEVEADLNVLELFMTSAIFAAVGFGPYRRHELSRLVDMFCDDTSEIVWREAAQTAMWVGNSRLLEQLPMDLRAPVDNIEASKSLAQLKNALDVAELI